MSLGPKCQKAEIFRFLIKLYIMSSFMGFSRIVGVSDWGYITRKVCRWVKEVPMYLGLKFQPS